jgi:uncharacterized protein
MMDDERHAGSLAPILALADEDDPDPELRPPPTTSKKTKKLLTHLAAGIVLIYP